MRRIGTLVLLTLLFTTSLPGGASTPDVTYEGRTFAAHVPSLGRFVGDSAAASSAPFEEARAFQSAAGGPASVEGGRAEYAGLASSSAAKFTATVVRVQVQGLLLEARGVQAEAVASCVAGRSSSRVERVLVAGAAVPAGPATPVPLPNGMTLILDEGAGNRLAARAEQATNALRVVDAAGATLAIVGHAEARAVGCARVEPGACASLQPMSTATARVGDARDAGAPELLVSPAGGASGTAQHAWLNGVWTNFLLEYDGVTRASTLTLRGATAATGRVNGVAPGVLVLAASAPEGRIDVEDLRLNGLALGDELGVEGGAAAWTLRSPLVQDGFTLEGSVRLAWDAARPPDADGLRLDLRLGRCG